MAGERFPDDAWCETCRFSKRDDDLTAANEGVAVFQCRRSPPVLLWIADGAATVRQAWPSVLADDSCGEWRGRPDAGNPFADDGRTDYRTGMGGWDGPLPDDGGKND